MFICITKWPGRSKNPIAVAALATTQRSIADMHGTMLNEVTPGSTTMVLTEKQAIELHRQLDRDLKRLGLI